MITTSVHPASLVPSARHSSEVLSMLELHPKSRGLVDYILALVTETVTCALNRPLSSASNIHAFRAFVKEVLHCARLKTPVILGAMVYIARGKEYLEIAQEEYALERVFLGAVVVAHKYLNDSCYRNYQWAAIVKGFVTKDINRMDREWCKVLDFEFTISEQDLLSLYPVLSLHCPAPPCPVIAQLPSPTGSTMSSSNIPYQYGDFIIFPSDLDSPSSSDNEWSPETADTLLFTPSPSQTVPDSSEVPADLEMHVCRESAATIAQAVQSDLSKSQLVHRRQASNHNVHESRRAYYRSLGSGSVVSKMRPRIVGRNTSVSVA
ncbi:hypothetical protein OE88DRAFT_1625875 [Heliocybe sulcata]|uniref:Cyclin N-terminal domain-containing protein n=1 Tax=Heliocybe sulcata TaxID=5364 RepID=A0A5C3N8R5_9AGAM|nr:hypothetical protein OE88DRAFT_1625875 [Heliocybe sulcata]